MSDTLHHKTIAFPFEASDREHNDNNISGSLDALGDVIKKYRKKNGLTQADLAEKLDVKRNTVIAWESNRNRPSLDMLMSISHLLAIPLMELFDVNMATSDMTVPEKRLVETHRKLNPDNQKVIERMAAVMLEEEQEAKAKMLMNDYRLIGTLPTSAAAGTGNEYLDNKAPLLTFYKKNSRFSRADFVCHVKGRSMEPAYLDGDYVYCVNANTADDGDIVICDSNDGRLIKQKQGNILISINPDPKYKLKKYPDDAVHIVGIVLGKVPDEDRPDPAMENELEDVHFDEVSRFKQKWDL